MELIPKEPDIDIWKQTGLKPTPSIEDAFDYICKILEFDIIKVSPPYAHVKGIWDRGFDWIINLQELEKIELDEADSGLHMYFNYPFTMKIEGKVETYVGGNRKLSPRVRIFTLDNHKEHAIIAAKLLSYCAWKARQ